MANQVDRIISNTNNLTLNIKDFHDETEFNIRIFNQMNKKNLIGRGFFGSAYLVEDGKYVVKEIKPCNRRELKSYCDNLKKLIRGNEITTIPSAKGKIRYLMPNLLSEIVIGMFMGKMNDTLESINFTKVVSSFYLLRNGNVEIYIVLEAHEKIIEKAINFDTQQEYKIINPNMMMKTPLQYLYFLFQVSHALMQAQEKYLFTHYDLHIDNMLWEKWPNDKNFISYPLSGEQAPNRVMMPKEKCRFIVKIADYGLSRMETNTVLITPKDDTKPEATFGEFNTSYDIVSLIGTTIIDIRLRDPFSPLFSNLVLFKKILEFILWIFNNTSVMIPENPSLTELQNIQKVLAKEYWREFRSKPGEVKFSFRPKPVEANLVAYYNTRSMSEITRYLVL